MFTLAAIGSIMQLTVMLSSTSRLVNFVISAITFVVFSMHQTTKEHILLIQLSTAALDPVSGHTKSVADINPECDTVSVSLLRFAV